MKIRYDATLISAVVISICLVAMIPGSLRLASTWRELYMYETPDMKIQNLQMPLGFYSLGFEITGLIVLWTGFRRKERWAWFVMLIILAFFIFPPYVLTLIVRAHEWKLGVADMWTLAHAAWQGDTESIGIVLGAATFFVVLASLLLPLRAFFGKSVRS